MDSVEIKAALANIKLLIDKPLKNFTFTKVGGKVDILAFPKTFAEVKKIIVYANEKNISWIVLGNASNLIIRDGGIRGIVILLSEMRQICVDGYSIEVETGAKLIDTTQIALEHSLTGLEFACGIPGSIGGAIFMNAGAYGGEISHVFASAKVLLNDGIIETWDAQKMNFGYRKSFLQGKKAIILSAKFELTKKNYAAIKARMDELTHFRQLKQPLEYPSCGCVFKRPTGFFTGKLIQDAGLKGFKLGGVQVSQKHAGFIVNINQATAKDYEELIQHIIKVVKAKFQVKLQPEVRIIGEN
ncbi:MAG: UDP-N-acetylmuramate dehydrogenase [Streptococcaceae bacterium]|nr:UDP-N-acetylmuramate dehydrogenase [Streptococcaceae bacterium]